jgi:hypothetical protein
MNACEISQILARQNYSHCGSASLTEVVRCHRDCREKEKSHPNAHPNALCQENLVVLVWLGK